MAYKFPWTNYHELNLDWIMDTVKKLFAQTEQNNAIVTQYDGRLTEVELIADNAQQAAEQAQQNSTAALDLAQNAAQTATQAQQAAGQAQQAAGQAQQAAGQAQQAAGQAQQTATQAQQTAQNFDGRITQAENNAANALQAAQAFDEQVQGAITAANNANEAATAALTTSAETSRELAAQRDTLEDIVSDGVDSLQEASQDATEEIETAGQTVLNSIPADYTALSELVDRKADVIYNTAAGDIASFNDGADDMKIKSLIINIEPAQAGSGNPSPTNRRPLSGHTGTDLYHETEYDADVNPLISYIFPSAAGTVYGCTINVLTGVLTVDRAIVIIDQNYTGLRRSGDHNFYISDLFSVFGTIPTSNIFIGSAVTGNNGYTFINSNGRIIMRPIDAYATVDDFIAALAPVEICYYITNPVEYQLTPQQVKTLYQNNSIWTSVGTVDVEYPADTKTYIDNKFAELQALILEH